MRAPIIENIEQLSYPDLLNAIENIKNKLKDTTPDDEMYDKMNGYYAKLVEEFDKRNTIR